MLDVRDLGEHQGDLFAGAGDVFVELVTEAGLLLPLILQIVERGKRLGNQVG